MLTDLQSVPFSHSGNLPGQSAKRHVARASARQQTSFTFLNSSWLFQPFLTLTICCQPAIPITCDTSQCLAVTPTVTPRGDTSLRYLTAIFNCDHSLSERGSHLAIFACQRLFVLLASRRFSLKLLTPVSKTTGLATAKSSKPGSSGATKGLEPPTH